MTMDEPRIGEANLRDAFSPDWQLQKPLFEIARENMERRAKEKAARREKREQAWKSFKDGVKAFAELGRMSITDGEIRSRIVDTVSEKAEAVATAVKTETRKIGSEMMFEFNAMCNEASTAIDDGIGVLEQKAAEVGKGLVTVVAREVIAPVIDLAVVPTVRALEAADEMVSGVEAKLNDVDARKKDRKAGKIYRWATSSVLDSLKKASEIPARAGEKRNWFLRLADKVSAWVDSQTVESVNLTMEADRLRQEAQNIREWYKNRQRTSTALGGVAAQLRSI